MSSASAMFARSGPAELLTLGRAEVVVAAALASVCLALTVDARAQGGTARVGEASSEQADAVPPPASGAEANARAYSAIVGEAVREFDLGHYPEARALFERAHGIHPNARTLRGIGMACFEMRDYPHAWVAFRAALANPERPLTSAQRSEVQSLLARTEVFLGRVRLVSAPPDIHLLVDGGEPVLDGELVVLAAGSHELRLTRPDGARVNRMIEVAAGRTHEFDVQEAGAPVVERPAESVGQASSPAAGGSGPREPGGPTNPPRRPSGIGFFVGAGASLVVAGVGAAYWANRSSTLSQCRDAIDAGRTCGNEQDLERQRNAGLAITVIGAAAAPALLVGGLVRRHRGEERGGTRASLDCGPFGAGVLCAGRF